jgi:hypothetical protein
MSDLDAEFEIELELFLLPAVVFLLFRNSYRQLAGAEVNDIWAAMAPLRDSGTKLAGGWGRKVESLRKKAESKTAASRHFRRGGAGAGRR